jgi:hypothetical protein
MNNYPADFKDYDVGLMWTEFLQNNIVFGAPLKEMMERRGWLKQPPFYHPPGLPNQQ